MNTTSLRRAIVPGVAAIALAASLAACGSSDDDSTASGGSSSASSGGAASGLSGKVAAGGSSAQEKAQESWRAGFGQANPDVTISYDPVGSGDGRANFISGAYAFAGTDSALDDDELKQAKSKCGGDPIEVPAFISPIDVIFNLKGVDTLNLDAKTIANIFNGTITKWNDQAIKSQNPDADLPATAISPVHRSDSSGTTDNFTDYLYQASGGAWKTEHSSDWPTTKGETGEGTSGVIGAVQGGDGTIGYADDSAVQGTKLGVVHVKVGSDYVEPSADGAAAGLAASKTATGTPASVMAYEINRTTTDPSTYPVFLTSYLVACPTYSDKTTADIVKGFLTYAVSDEGQKAAAANAFSAPLPSDISAKATDIISKIS
ncbi:phosphate ABC transporter substrate-binding protein PstS [Nocardioides sp. KR10-350]|uniref:phosphate ABC transporter substrate-binding protein PstS n=1 Tax=Nocardioides cheoyonin TaxID=3156615 RepID=UPI0032B5E351